MSLTASIARNSPNGSNGEDLGRSGRAGTPYPNLRKATRLKDMNDTPAKSATEVLPSHECWGLLRGVSVGRLAVWLEDHPEIFPVNFTVDHGSIVFRTAPGSNLKGATGAAPVAFEADGVDADTGIAWSVVVKGSAAALESTGDVLDSFALSLFPWQPGRKDTFVRIVPTEITGRRFKVSQPAEWWTAQSDATQSSPE